MPAQHEFAALWDTGATGSVISQNVVAQCGLKPTGMITTHGVHGPQDVETFLVNFYLPNTVAIPNVRVSMGKIHGGEILIGMDIIGLGSFAVSNFHGKTTFTFRMPSDREIDFVGADNYKNAMAQQLQNRQARRTSKKPRLHK